MKIHLETERFLLRDLIEADAQDMFELDSDPEVHKYLGNKPVQSIETILEVIQHVRRQYETNGIGRWAVIDKATNAWVGWSGLKYEQRITDGSRYYDVGYRLKRAFWGKGIATETAQACIQYGFEQLNLEVLNAAAHVDNAASNRVLQKVGFQFVETFYYDTELCNWYQLEKSNFYSQRKVVMKKENF
jgi:ribosomal-protein-alanine N-acetyltransferase